MNALFSSEQSEYTLFELHGINSSCDLYFIRICCYVWFQADPFAEANTENSSARAKEYVHVDIQQRNGRKSLTSVQGLKKEFSYSKILKDFKK